LGLQYCRNTERAGRHIRELFRNLAVRHDYRCWFDGRYSSWKALGHGLAVWDQHSRKLYVPFQELGHVDQQRDGFDNSDEVHLDLCTSAHLQWMERQISRGRVLAGHPILRLNCCDNHDGLDGVGGFGCYHSKLGLRSDALRVSSWRVRNVLCREDYFRQGSND
jgi:hypothetical protein